MSSKVRWPLLLDGAGGVSVIAVDGSHDNIIQWILARITDRQALHAQPHLLAVHSGCLMHIQASVNTSEADLATLVVRVIWSITSRSFSISARLMQKPPTLGPPERVPNPQPDALLRPPNCTQTQPQCLPDCARPCPAAGMSSRAPTTAKYPATAVYACDAASDGPAGADVSRECQANGRWGGSPPTECVGSAFEVLSGPCTVEQGGRCVSRTDYGNNTAQCVIAATEAMTTANCPIFSTESGRQPAVQWNRFPS